MNCLVSAIDETLDWRLYTANSCLIQKNRRVLTERALADGCTTIIHVDSDMIFPADTFKVLRDSPHPVTAANCVKRRFPLEFTAQVPTLQSSKGYQQVRRVGTGIMAIKAEVLGKLPKPWFAVAWDGEKEVGEDYYFCDLCHEAGVPVFVDHDLSKRIGHLGLYEYRYE
jgi:hypothetical protein